MAFSASGKNPANVPRIISIRPRSNFYEALQHQLEEAVSLMTPDQKIAALILLGLSALVQSQGETAAPEDQDESTFAWGYLSRLQKELPEGQMLGDLLRAANLELVINNQPVDLQRLSKPLDDEFDDPFENFKRGWDDAMQGSTMSFEEFERRMLEDAD